MVMKNRMKLVVLLVAAFIISLIPIILISSYAVPVSDDIVYSAVIRNGVIDGKKFLELINLAFAKVGEIYNNWQGTYTSLFFMVMQPGAFGEAYYSFGIQFIVGLLIFANLYSCKVIFKHIIGEFDLSWIICGITISFFQIQFLPSAKEGIFWWSGAVMHTMILSAQLIQFSLVLKLLTKQNKIFFTFLLICLMTIFTGGGAYQLSLLNFTMYGLILFFYIMTLKVNEKSIKNGKILILMVFICISLVCLYINVSAPGNQIRIDQSGANVSAIAAILLSFVYSIIFSFEYLNLGTFFVTVLIFYFTYPKIRKLKIKVAHPLLSLIATWCVYSAIFTPAIYGENFVAAPRYLNILYFSFFWFIIANLLLTLIYFKDNEYVELSYNYLNKITSKNFYISCLFFFVLSVSSIFSFSYYDTTSFSALVDLVNGYSASHREISNIRVSLLNDQSKPSVILPNYNKMIKILMVDTLEGTNSFQIDNYKTYYNKKTIIINDEE